MSPDNILVPYIPKGDKISEEVKGKKFEIWSTKQEQAFLPFKNKDSFSYRLCNLAKNDVGILTLFFLKYITKNSPIEEYPLEIELPIFVEVNDEFVKDILNGKYSEKVKKLETKIRKMIEEYGELNARVTWEIIAMIMSDPKFKQIISRKKKKHIGRDEISSLFKDIAPKHEKEIKNFYEELNKVVVRNYSALEQYIPTIEAYNSVRDAKNNMEILSSIFKEDIANVLEESLAKLIAHRIVRMKLTSLCLECILRKQFEPLHISEIYPGAPKFLKQCDKCNGKTVFHKVLLQIPGSLTPLILENRIQEFMTGFILADMEIAKRIYIHKKVHRVKESRLPGVEVDVFAVTNNDEIILVEVTKSDDLTNVMNNINTKVENFEPLEYDYLFYVTGARLKRHLTYGGTNTYILGINHLPRLKEHIQHMIKK